jgi:type III secretion protein SpaR/YscT/HrcT
MATYESSSGLLLMVAVLSARIGAALAMFPMFSAGAIPMSVRTTITAGMAVCLLPMMGMGNIVALGALDAMTLALLLAKEVALGFALGLVGSMGFWAVHAAGSIIENQAGLSMAATVDPLAGQEDSLIGGFLVQVLSVVFVASGGLLSLLGVLYESFRVWPVTELTPNIDPALWLSAAMQVIRGIFDLAVRVAAPFVLLMLMVEVGLGLLGRYAPQFSVFFLAMPIKAVVLVVLLLIYAIVLSDASSLPDVAGAIRHLFPPAK